MPLLGYRKLTEEEDALRGLIMDGEYQALITKVEEKKSKGGLDKNGNNKPIFPMLMIDFLVNDFGRDRNIKSWIMLDGEMSWQFRHLAISCGLLHKYENNTLEVSDFMNKKPIIKIAIKDGFDMEGNKIKRNNIVDYLASADEIEQSRFNDDIKF